MLFTFNDDRKEDGTIYFTMGDETYEYKIEDFGRPNFTIPFAE